MKIIVTTSDNYINHLLPIFVYLFNNNFGSDHAVEVVGYTPPAFSLPPNFSFHSMGKQGSVHEFSNDLAKFFKTQPCWFIWMMEDTFIKEVDHEKLNTLKELTNIPKAGRINITNAGRFQDHLSIGEIKGVKICENTQDAKYRLSTQPSMWNRYFLLQYMTKNLSPWAFECQPSINDNWRIFGPEDHVVSSNEGVTKHDIRKYNLDGIKSEQIDEMTKLGYL